MTTYRTDRVPACRRSVEELVRLRVERQAAPSSVFAVFTPDGIAAFGGYAQHGAAPTPDTAYRIASCTKSFTAAGLLLLRDRGALSLDDPVDAHLAVGPFTGPTGDRTAAPTLGLLASMSGGLPTDDPWADRQESLAPQAFDALVARGVRLAGPPGTRYEYSNLGFALLGRVVERVTGRSYPSFVTEELLRPLGLDGAAYDQRVPAADRVAHGYQRVDGAWVEQPFSAPGAFSAIGGLFATTRSLARWASWLAAAFGDGGAPGPLGAASRREMQRVVRPIPAPGPGVAAWGYGYGLVVESTERHGVVVSHSGGYPGFGAHVRWHPASGVGVVALENATYSHVGAAAATALRTVLDETVVPDALPVLWPETVRARDAVEVLVRGWDDAWRHRCSPTTRPSTSPSTAAATACGGSRPRRGSAQGHPSRWRRPHRTATPRRTWRGRCRAPAGRCGARCGSPPRSRRASRPSPSGTGRWPRPQQLAEPVHREARAAVAVAAHHGLAGHEDVEHRLLHALHDRLEQRVDLGRPSRGAQATGTSSLVDRGVAGSACSTRAGA